MNHDIDYLYGLLLENHLDLMYLPSGAVAWLFDRPEAQVHAASRLGVEAHRYENPVVDAALLRADQNVLVLKTQAGQSFKVYPDGGYGMDGRPLDEQAMIQEIQNLPSHEMMGGEDPMVDPEMVNDPVGLGMEPAEPEMVVEPEMGDNSGLTMQDLLVDEIS